LKGGWSKRNRQYAGVSSITRNGAADSVITRAPCFRLGIHDILSC